MPVNYSVVQQKFDMSGNDNLKFYARAQASGAVDFRSMCETISDRSTVTKADALASLDGFLFVMRQALKEGKIVRLGDFGSFQVSLSSEGTILEKDFSSSNIKRPHILFRPSRDLQETLNNLTYQKVAIVPSPVAEPDDSGTGTGG